MVLTYYRYPMGAGETRLLCSVQADLPWPKVEPCLAAGELLYYLFSRPYMGGRASYALSDARLCGEVREGLHWLDSSSLVSAAPQDDFLAAAIAERRVRAVNMSHPRWQALLQLRHRRPVRVHILALGDVGATVAMGLKLLGAPDIAVIGLYDREESLVKRWCTELSQVAAATDYWQLPRVEPVAPADLFACDLFLFCASKAVPPLGSGGDVRMAQYAANRLIVAEYARMARQQHFAGKFIVVSDPVDPLCREAFLASNRNEDGVFDGQGLFAEQVIGCGLGVMYARAAAVAAEQPQLQYFFTEGRAYGPHGQDLVIADSVLQYQEEVSAYLTEQAVTANLRLRQIGFKPFIAPALSSAALTILAMLRGQWHDSSFCLGGIWFGARNRYGVSGGEAECLALPRPLYQRLERAYTNLWQLACEE